MLKVFALAFENCAGPEPSVAVRQLDDLGGEQADELGTWVGRIEPSPVVQSCGHQLGKRLDRELGAFDDNDRCRCSTTRQPSETSGAATRVVLAFLEAQIDELASPGMVVVGRALALELVGGFEHEHVLSPCQWRQWRLYGGPVTLSSRCSALLSAGQGKASTVSWVRVSERSRCNLSGDVDGLTPERGKAE